jgi:hypothetical protein
MIGTKREMIRLPPFNPSGQSGGGGRTDDHDEEGQ